jgi:hypothetical protein
MKTHHSRILGHDTRTARRQFLVNLPGEWDHRRTLHNVVRVSLLDVLEQYGWTVRSTWNTDKASGFLPPQPLVELCTHDGKEQISSESFKGECANFLLSKGARSPRPFPSSSDNSLSPPLRTAPSSDLRRGPAQQVRLWHWWRRRSRGNRAAHRHSR